MTAKKQKQKERRRARKLADQAWEAVNEENLDLALKIIRRAVATQIENPVLWNDQGMILSLMQRNDEADESFRAALSLAPDFAEPYANLAAIRLRQGFVSAAVELQSKAVLYSPSTDRYTEQLEAYRALFGPEQQPAQPEHVPEVPSPTGQTFSEDAVRVWIPRLDALDWEKLAEQLSESGFVRIPKLIDAATCVNLREMFQHDNLFAKTVVMKRDDFGRGVYRYFRAPIPEVVDSLRRAMYRHVAHVANNWQRWLNREDAYPDDWQQFQQLCHSAGQSAPTPILLHYEAGGFNCLHRDLRGEVYFPIQMAVVLSSQQTDFQGGEFLFCDFPERKNSCRRVVPAGLGDTLLFCTRDRLVKVGGVYGLQPVKHGVAEITRGTRYVLGTPFHEYR